jgi:hypothetical protein
MLCSILFRKPLGRSTILVRVSGVAFRNPVSLGASAVGWQKSAVDWVPAPLVILTAQTAGALRFCRCQSDE